VANGGRAVQCLTNEVIVGGKEAVWIFLDFETDYLGKARPES
jgi:hypothetical protein